MDIYNGWILQQIYSQRMEFMDVVVVVMTRVDIFHNGWTYNGYFSQRTDLITDVIHNGWTLTPGPFCNGMIYNG